MTYHNFGTGNSVTNIFLASTNPIPVSKTGFVFARRTLGTHNTIIMPLSDPNTNYPSPYVPFYLPSYTNGLAALSALTAKGFQFTLGTSVTVDTAHPDIVSTNATTGITTLTWNTEIQDLAAIQGNQPTGAVTQATSGASGTIRTVVVALNTTVVTLVYTNGSSVFDLTHDLTFSCILAGQSPDPATSDEIAVFVNSYYGQFSSVPNFLTSPDLYVSPLIDGIDTSISPSTATITLVAPTSAVTNEDLSQTLTYPVDAYQLGLLPNIYFGNTTVTQVQTGTPTVTVVGTFNGFVFNTSGSSQVVQINVINVTSTPTASVAFDATHAVTIVLDASQNGGTLLPANASIANWAMCFPVANATELTENHADYVALINAKRLPTAVQQNSYNPRGYYGYMPAHIGSPSLATYTAPNSLAFVFCVKLDIPTIYQPACNNVIDVACKMFSDCNNEYPFYDFAGSGAVLNQTVSNNQASIAQVTTDALNQLVSQGCNPTFINNLNQACMYANVTTLQTNQGVQDLEYRYIATQQKKTWLDINENQLATISTTITYPNGTTVRANNSPDVISMLDTNLKGLLAYASSGTNGIPPILGTNNNSVTIALDSDVTLLDVTVTTSFVPPNRGVNIVNYIQSYTI